MFSSIVLVVLFIGILIIFHEFGHLVAAKLSHIPVEVFSVGFGPVILKKKIGETEYRLSAIPLGGFSTACSTSETPSPGCFRSHAAAASMYSALSPAHSASSSSASMAVISPLNAISTSPHSS